MFSKKNYIIVGLTTFHTEFLRISVPGLDKMKKDIYLIIHNDNPEIKLKKSQIKKLGYRGSLHIINASKNVGPLVARLNILSSIPKLKKKSDWMIFLDDDDILTNVDVPVVKEYNFAIMQNMAFIKKRLLDVFKIADNPNSLKVDDNHITVERPHIGIVGTLIRTNLMIKVGDLIREIKEKIHEVDNSLGTRSPEDVVMWFYLQMYAKSLNEMSEPIYMDRTNYVAVTLDSTTERYGKKLIPDNQPAEYYNNTMDRYCSLFAELLSAKNNISA